MAQMNQKISHRLTQIDTDGRFAAWVWFWLREASAFGAKRFFDTQPTGVGLAAQNDKSA